MRPIPVYGYGPVSAGRHDDIRAVVQSQPTLGDVLAWARALTPPQAPVAIIAQDEYTHDVVLSLEADVYLAYDTT